MNSQDYRLNTQLTKVNSSINGKSTYTRNESKIIDFIIYTYLICNSNKVFTKDFCVYINEPYKSCSLMIKRAIESKGLIEKYMSFNVDRRYIEERFLLSIDRTTGVNNNGFIFKINPECEKLIRINRSDNKNNSYTKLYLHELAYCYKQSKYLGKLFEFFVMRVNLSSHHIKNKRKISLIELRKKLNLSKYYDKDSQFLKFIKNHIQKLEKKTLIKVNANWQKTKENKTNISWILYCNLEGRLTNNSHYIDIEPPKFNLFDLKNDDLKEGLCANIHRNKFKNYNKDKKYKYVENYIINKMHNIANNDINTLVLQELYEEYSNINDLYHASLIKYACKNIYSDIYIHFLIIAKSEFKEKENIIDQNNDKNTQNYNNINYYSNKPKVLYKNNTII